MKTILLLTDFSRKSESAAEFALKIAQNAKANILLCNLFVIPEALPVSEINWSGDTFSVVEEDSLNRLLKQRERLLDRINAEENATFTPTIGCISQMGSISESISTLVEKYDIWMVVMGAKGDSGVSNFLFGSHTYEAIDKAHCPVLLIPEAADLKDFSKVALATDLLMVEMNLIDFLIDFSKLLESELVITHVPSNERIWEEGQMHVDSLKNQFITQFHNLLATYQDIKGEEVETKLEEFSIQENIDILSIVHRKQNLLERIFHSNTTKILIRHSKSPLLVLPG